MIYVPTELTDDPWYVQCRYETTTPDGRQVGTSWLPEALAVVGKRIYFGEKTAEPRTLWTITHVFGRLRWSELRARTIEHGQWRDHAGVPGIFRGEARRGKQWKLKRRNRPSWL